MDKERDGRKLGGVQTDQPSVRYICLLAEGLALVGSVNDGAPSLGVSRKDCVCFADRSLLQCTREVAQELDRGRKSGDRCALNPGGKERAAMSIRLREGGGANQETRTGSEVTTAGRLRHALHGSIRGRLW